MKQNNSIAELYSPFPTYLTRQNDKRIADLRYGKAHMKIQTVGCGLVALCNVMKRLGNPQAFTQIIADAQRLRMPWLFGLFGTKPRSLGRYFKLHNVPYRLTTDCEEFRRQLFLSSTAIICTWCDKRTDGIHFFTVLNDNGKLSALNRYNADAPTCFSVQDVHDNRFICGYLFNKVESYTKLN